MKEKETTHEIFDESLDHDLNEKVKQEAGLTVNGTTKTDFQMQRLSIDNIDDLDDAEEAPIELSSEYWTPKLPGEQRRVIFDRIETKNVPSVNNPDELIELECAFFLVKEDGSVKQIYNGGRRLVNTLISFNIQHGTPLQITYEGKVKNKNNNFSSDSWAVVPLIPKKK